MLRHKKTGILEKTHFATLAPKSKPQAAKRTPLTILLVEDVASDALLTRLALDATNIPYTLRRLQKGTDVLPYLRGCLTQEPTALPDLIMLDFGLPCKDGFEVLADLNKTLPAIRAVPIVILTGHADFEYVGRNYNLYIPAYINKPCCAEKISDVLISIRDHRYAA